MQATNELPPISVLRELFSYDPEEGVVRWKPRPLHTFENEAKGKTWNSRYAGTTGAKDPLRGYLKFRLVLDGKELRLAAHRIAWALHHGVTKFGELDHKNIDPSDNRIENLRLATRRGQSANRKAFGKYGLPKGVQPSGGRYAAVATVNGENKYFGRFETPEEAHAAFCVETHEHHGEFFHSGLFDSIEEARRVYRAALQRREEARAANSVHEVIVLVDEPFLDAAAAAMRKLWSFKLRRDIDDKVKAELDAIGLSLSTHLARLETKNFGHLRTE